MSNPIHTFNHDFFAEEAPAARTRLNEVAGGIGLWLLHLIKISLLGYTSYHAIHAALLFASEPLARVFQIFGFIAVDLTLLGLYIAYLNKMIAGAAQKIAAGIVYAICFAIAGAAVVIDSQIAVNGVESLAGSAALYFNWVLPVVPLLAGLGAAVVHVLDEDNRAEQVQQATHRRHARELHNLKFMAQVRREQTELDVQKTVANLQLASRLHVAKTLHDIVQQPTVLRQLQSQAQRDLPALLSAAGIDVGPFTLEAQATPEPITLPSSSADMLDSIWIPPTPPIDSDSPNGAVIDDEAWTVERFLSLAGRTREEAVQMLRWFGGSGGSDSSAKPPSTASRHSARTWALSCLTRLTWPLSRLSITT